MITGKRQPTGITLSMNMEDAKRLYMSLEATAKVCEGLVASGPVENSVLSVLPGSVIRALWQAQKEHLADADAIKSAMSEGPYASEIEGGNDKGGE